MFLNMITQETLEDEEYNKLNQDERAKYIKVPSELEGQDLYYKNGQIKVKPKDTGEWSDPVFNVELEAWISRPLQDIVSRPYRLSRILARVRELISKDINLGVDELVNRLTNKVTVFSGMSDMSFYVLRETNTQISSLLEDEHKTEELTKTDEQDNSVSELELMKVFEELKIKFIKTNLAKADFLIRRTTITGRGLRNQNEFADQIDYLDEDIEELKKRYNKQ